MPIDLSNFERALSEVLDKKRNLETVYLAEYIAPNTDPASGDPDGTHRVYIINPDGTRGPEKDVRGRVRNWPGLIIRLSVDHQRNNPDELFIMGVDEAGYGVVGAPSGLEEHGYDHGYNQVDEIMNLYTWQIYPLRVQPYSGKTVAIQGGIYFAGGAFDSFTYTTLDLTAYWPGSNYKYVTLSINSSGSVVVTEGAVVFTTAASNIPPPPAGNQPIGAVLLRASASSVERSDCTADMRYLLSLTALSAAASQVGEVYYSTNGTSFSNELPLTNAAGWMVNDEGTLLVVG
jgi:hypothetical protein